MNLLSNSFFIAASALLFNWIFPFCIKLPLFFLLLRSIFDEFFISENRISIRANEFIALWKVIHSQNCAIHTEIEQEMQFTSRSRSLTCCRWLRFITSQNFMQKQRVFRLEEILHVWHRTLSWHRNCIWRLFKWIFYCCHKMRTFTVASAIFYINLIFHADQFLQKLKIEFNNMESM